MIKLLVGGYRYILAQGPVVTTGGASVSTAPDPAQVLDQSKKRARDFIATIDATIVGNQADKLDELKRKYLGEIEKAANPADVQKLKEQFGQEVDALGKAAGKTTDVQAKATQDRVEVSTTPPVDGAASFNQGTLDEAVKGLGESQKNGQGAYQTFGPMGVTLANQQADEINKNTAQTGVAASVQTDGAGQSYLVVYNKNQGVIESFRSEPGYTAFNPDYPEIVNRHPVASIGAALAQIALGIASGVEKRTQQFQGATMDNLIQGDKVLPEEKGKPIKEGPRVEIKWRAPEPGDHGHPEPPPMEEESGNVDDGPELTHKSKVTSGELAGNVDGRASTVSKSMLDQFGTQNTGTQIVDSSTGKVKGDAVAASNYRHAFSDLPSEGEEQYFRKIGYQEMGYMQGLYSDKPIPPQSVDNLVRQEVNREGGSLPPPDKVPPAWLEAAQNGQHAGREDREFILGEYKRSHNGQTPTPDELKTFIDETYKAPAQKQWDTAHSKGPKFDTLNPAQQALLIRDQIQTPQIAANIFDQAGKGWEQSSVDQRKEMFPGLPGDAYSKSWNQLGDETQAQAVRSGILKEPPTIQLTAVAQTDPSQGTWDPKTKEWKFKDTAQDGLARARVDAAKDDILAALKSRGVFQSGEDGAKIKGKITGTAQPLHTPLPPSPTKGTPSGPLNLDQEAAKITTAVNIPAPTGAGTQISGRVIRDGETIVGGSGFVKGPDGTHYDFDANTRSLTVTSPDGNSKLRYDIGTGQVVDLKKDPPDNVRPMTPDDSLALEGHLKNVKGDIGAVHAESTRIIADPNAPQPQKDQEMKELEAANAALKLLELVEKGGAQSVGVGESELSVNSRRGNITLTHTADGTSSTYAYDHKAKTISVKTGDQEIKYDFKNNKVSPPDPARDMTAQDRQVIADMQGIIQASHGNTPDSKADDMALSLLKDLNDGTNTTKLDPPGPQVTVRLARNPDSTPSAGNGFISAAGKSYAFDTMAQTITLTDNTTTPKTQLRYDLKGGRVVDLANNKVLPLKPEDAQKVLGDMQSHVQAVEAESLAAIGNVDEAKELKAAQDALKLLGMLKVPQPK